MLDLRSNLIQMYGLFLARGQEIGSASWQDPNYRANLAKVEDVGLRLEGRDGQKGHLLIIVLQPNNLSNDFAPNYTVVCLNFGRLDARMAGR